MVYFTTTFYIKTKYVVVFWIETNEENAVRDITMLSHFGKRGMVYHKDIGKKAPKGGWKAYMAQVVSIHGKYLPLKYIFAELIICMDTNMPQLPSQQACLIRKNT